MEYITLHYFIVISLSLTITKINRLSSLLFGGILAAIYAVYLEKEEKEENQEEGFVIVISDIMIPLPD